MKLTCSEDTSRSMFAGIYSMSVRNVSMKKRGCNNYRFPTYTDMLRLSDAKCPTFIRVRRPTVVSRNGDVCCGDADVVLPYAAYWRYTVLFSNGPSPHQVTVIELDTFLMALW